MHKFMFHIDAKYLPTAGSRNHYAVIEYKVDRNRVIVERASFEPSTLMHLVSSGTMIDEIYAAANNNAFVMNYITPTPARL